MSVIKAQKTFLITVFDVYFSNLNLFISFKVSAGIKYRPVGGGDDVEPICD